MTLLPSTAAMVTVRPGLGHGDGLAGGGLVAVGVGDQCSDGGGAVGEAVASVEGMVAVHLVPVPFTVAT